MYDAAENLRLEASRDLARSEVARIKEADAQQQKYDALKELLLEARADLDRTETERKLLFDRIVQLSGQPALYNPAALSAQDPLASNSPGPERRVGFDDVHRACRQSLADGTYGVRGIKS